MLNNNEQRNSKPIVTIGAVLEKGENVPYFLQDSEDGEVFSYKNQQGQVETRSKHQIKQKKYTDTVQGISLVESKFGESVVLKFKDCSIFIKVDSIYGEQLLKCIPNIKVGEEYSFCPYLITTDGKTKRGLSIKKGDTRVDDFFYGKELDDQPKWDSKWKGDKKRTKKFFEDLNFFIYDYVKTNYIKEVSPDEMERFFVE